MAGTPMYREFYGFTSAPFSLNPDPKFAFTSDTFSSARAILEYAVLQQEGVFVVTGDIGCGKTTLIYSLLNRAGERSAIGVVSNPAELDGLPMQGILRAFNQQISFKYEVELYARFHSFLENQSNAGRAILLIIDEAQSLSTETLEMLRKLTNPAPHAKGILQLVLVGQSRLNQILQLPESEELMQRVVARYHIPVLSQDETIKYILYRLMRAGCNKALFTMSALLDIYHGSCGIPRVINLICDTALMYGYAQDVVKIDRQIVEQVMADRGIAGLSDQSTPASLEFDRSSAKLLTGLH